MPINTIKCPHCGARVNHTIRAGSSFLQGASVSIGCPRCKQQFEVSKSDLSVRTKEELEELEDFEKLMNGVDDSFAKAVVDEGGDSVEIALDRATKVFAEARGALDEISIEDTGKAIDADELLTTFSVPDVKQFAMGKAQQAVSNVQEKYDLSDETTEVVSNIVDNAVDSAYDRVRAKVSAKVAEKTGGRVKDLADVVPQVQSKPE